MSFIGLPPGNILQNMYLKERLKILKKQKPLKTFLEIGSGNGHVSKILLQQDLTGIGIDLNESACLNNQKLNEIYIQKGKYKIIHGDFLNTLLSGQFDIIISYMVIEHLTEEERKQFLQKAKTLLTRQGYLIIQVPAGMKHWNIEDEIAGHLLRYEEKDIHTISKSYNLKINNLA